MSQPFDPEIVAAFIAEARLTLAPIASALQSRLRGEAELERELEQAALRATVAVEQTASFLGFHDVSRLSCALAALLNARRRGQIAARPEDLRLLTRALDRLHQAVNCIALRESIDVTVEIDAIKSRLIAEFEREADAADYRVAAASGSSCT